MTIPWFLLLLIDKNHCIDVSKNDNVLKTFGIPKRPSFHSPLGLHLFILVRHPFNFLLQQSNFVCTSFSKCIESIESLALSTTTYRNLIIAVLWGPSSSGTSTGNVTTVLIAVKATLLSILEEEVGVIVWAWRRGDGHSISADTISDCRPNTRWAITNLLTGYISWGWRRRAKYGIENWAAGICKAAEAN